MTWGTVNLGDVTSVRTGKLDANASSKEGEYPFFTCARKPLRISSYSYDCECVLVAGNGDLNAKYYHGKFDAYQRTYIVEARPESQGQLHLRYVYHFLESYLVTLREQSIGGIIKYIKLGNLTGAKIPLPPLDEQKRIARILDAADALRAKRRESLAQLDTLLQSTFLDMFGDPVTNPKGWEVGSLQDVTRKITDGTHKTPKYTDSGVEFLSAKDIKDGEIRWNTGKFISPEEHAKLIRRCNPEPGDLLLAKSGSLGSVAIIDRDHDISLFESLCLIKRDPKRIVAPFLLCMIRNPTMQVRLLGKNKGVAIKHLHLIDIRSLKIPIPPLDLQKRFATIVTAIEKQKARHRAHLEELDTLFASLQSRAFRGDL